MTKTKEIFLTPDSPLHEVRKFLLECQDIAEQCQGQPGHEAFIQSLATILQRICTETELKPAYLKSKVNTSLKKWLQTCIYVVLWSDLCAAVIYGALATALEVKGFFVRAIPGSALRKTFGCQRYSKSAMSRLLSLWQPMVFPVPCSSLSYHEVPLKYAVVGNCVWAVSPWADANSVQFVQFPDWTAKRAIQYLSLARRYDSITDKFVGTDIPRHLWMRPDRAEYLMAGYTNNIEVAVPLQIQIETGYGLMMSTRRLAIHPVKREGDTCVLFSSSGGFYIDLDSNEDLPVSFLAYPITGDEVLYPLANIARGEIPPEIVEKIYFGKNR